MPTFNTPDPIHLTVELGVGDIRIVASERTDTIVEVRPRDVAKASDVAAAEQTRVEYAGGRLLIRAPKGWRQWTLRGGGDSIDIQVELPTGSHVRADAGIAVLRCTGRLGECRFKTGIGEIRLDEAGPLKLDTGMGDITIERASDHTEVTTRSGTVQVGSIDGTAMIKNSNGDTWIGEAGDDLRVNAANGKITVDCADASVTAKTANGDVRLGEVARGAVLAQTACGRVDVGIREGVAAWLDLDTHCGNVESYLDAADRPQSGEDAVEVRARSAFGDITVRRATSPSDDRSKESGVRSPRPARSEPLPASQPQAPLRG